MANKFLIKRGSAAPNNAAIDNYELVYNYTDNELWTKHNGSVVKVASGNVGTVTNVVAGNGLTGGGTSTATLDLDFSELTDMTGDISGTTEFILQNGTVESRKAASEINLSAFNNDLSLSSGTVTSVTAGTGMTQSGTSTVNPTLNVVGENGLAASANAIGLDLSPLSAVGVNNLVDEDLFAVEIAIGGAIKKLTASSLKTYIGGGTITSVSGMTNNNVLTASGSTTISGESNLTFSSGVLSIDNDDVNEGGQINLLPGTGHTSTYTIDNFYGHLRFFSSATAGEQFRLTSTGNLAQLTGTKHYFNGDGGNTYIDEVASGQLRLVAGGTEAIKFYSSGAIDMYGGSTTSRSINIGANRSGNGYSYIDLVGDATYSDFGARFIRENTGPNTGTAIEHRGTGVLSLNAKDAGSVRFYTSNTERVRIDSSGNIGVGNIAPTNFGAGFTNLQISGSTAGVLQTTDSTNSATTEMITTSGVGYVGTRSNHQVRFKSNNSTAMTIDTSQRVGIGVVSPQNKLHVDATTTSNVVARFNTDSTFTFIDLYNDDLNRVQIGNADDGDFIIRTADAERFRVDKTTGNVGIGVASPASALHVVAAGLSNSIRASNTTSDATTKYGTYLGSHYTNSEEPVTGMLITSGSASATGNLVTIGGGVSAANAANIIRFFTAPDKTTLTGTEKMRIDNSGNVGIGVVSPNSLLHLYSTSNTQLRLQTTGTANASNIVYQNGTASYSVGINSAEQFSFYSSQLSGDAGFINTNGWLYWYNPILLTTNNTALKGRDSGGTVRDMLKIDANNDLVIGDSGLNDVYINQNVGIGTASPTSKVHIYNGDGSIPDDANNHLLVEDDGHSYIGIGGGTSSDTGIHFMDSGGIRGRIAYKHSSDAMDFKTANAVQMTINSSGNVGIGASSNINERLNVYHSSSADVLGIIGVGSAASTNFANINFRNLYSSATGDSAIIGCDTGSTTDKGELVFSTSGGSMNATEKMRITSGGNVGVGASNPLRKLHVVGDFAVNGATDQYYGIHMTGGESNDPKILIGDWHNSSGSIMWDSSENVLKIDSQHSAANRDIVFTGNDFATEYMRVNATGLGIGTSPSAKLHIYNTSTTSDGDGSATQTASGQDSILLRGHEGTNGATYGGITWLGGSSRRRAMITGVAENTDTDFVGLAFYTQGTDGSGDFYESMRISHAGNVGIGQASPGYKLDITHAGSGLRLNSSGDQQLRFERTSGNAFSIEHDTARMYLYNRTTSAATVAVTNAGNFGIGTVSPATKLHLMSGDLFLTANSTSADSGQGIYWQSTTSGWNTGQALGAIFGKRVDASNGYLRFDTRSSGTTAERMRLINTGALHVINDVVAFSSTPSDQKLKTNVKDIEYGLDTIMKLKPKQYDWKKDNRHDIGFIAQEVEEVIPEIVKDNEWFDDKIKTMDYEKLTAVLIKAVQEQQEQINELKEKLNG